MSNISKAEIDKSYSQLSTSVARLKSVGYSDIDLDYLDPTSQSFQEAQRKAMLNAQVTVPEPVNTNDEEVKSWYKGTRSLIQSSSRVLIMSLIEMVRGLFPFAVMIALIIADGVRLFHSINLLVNDVGISGLLAFVGILAYILLVYRKSEATYNFMGTNEEYEKWSTGIAIRDLGYRFSFGGRGFSPQKISRAEWEYRSSKGDVAGFKMLMFALIVLSPLLDPAILKSLIGNGLAQVNFLTGQVSGATDIVLANTQAPIQIVLSVLLNAFLTIKFLSMLDSNIVRAYALYADRDGDQAKGLGYFLEQQRLYRIKVEEVTNSAQIAFLKQRQQEAKLILAKASQAMEQEAKAIAAATRTDYPEMIHQPEITNPSQNGYQISPIFRDPSLDPRSSSGNQLGTQSVNQKLNNTKNY